MAAEQAKSLFNRITRAHYSEFQNPTTGDNQASQNVPGSFYNDDEDQFNEEDTFNTKLVLLKYFQFISSRAFVKEANS